MKSKMKCKVCQEEKPLAEMRKNIRTKRGYENICCSCRRKQRKGNLEYMKETVRRHAKEAGQKTPLVGIGDLMELQFEHPNCPYCAIELNDANRTIDHVYAKTSIYGAHIPANLVYCCRSCNSAKHTYTVVEFYDRSEKFTYELLKTFIQTVIGPKMMDVKVLDDDIPAFIKGLRKESEEMRKIEQKLKKSVG